MIPTEHLASLTGTTVLGQDGDKIGDIVDVYESADGPQGTFVTVSTGLFGTHASFVPLAEATMRGDDVVVPYGKELIKDAPRVQADQDLTAQEEERLHQHYGPLGGVAQSAAPVAPAATATGGPAGRSGDDDDDAMTRSEEHLQVGTQQVESGRARLRKRVVSETVAATVPVHHERARVVHEPITDANRDQALDGPELTEAVHEVTLHDEKPVVTKETVPVERVRLGSRTVTDDVQVSEQVRKEQVEVDRDVQGQGGPATPRDDQPTSPSASLPGREAGPT